MPIIKLTDGKYTGLSRDIKPRDARLGASFYEYDTELLWDKTLDINNGNNGWKLRPSIESGDGGNSSILKSKLTIKTLENIPFIVLMAGSDNVNFEVGDLVLGEPESDKLIFGKVTVENISTVAQLKAAMAGRIINS